MADDKLDLSNLRERIDALDDAILDLLNQRAGISVSVGRYKADSAEQVFKPFREKEVLDRLLAANPGPLPEQHLIAIYTEILSSSRRLQRPERVVYLGPEGTFSYFAGLEHLGHSAQMTPKANFEEIFRAVAKEGAELGIVPIENSLQGTVGQSVDLFLKYPVYIQAEVYSRISHSLLSRADSLDGVHKVYSHAQPLAQCRAWLEKNLPGRPLIPVDSTAIAAELVAEEMGAAAVAHVLMAEKLNLTILAEHVEDLPDNWTRFLVIGPNPGREEGRDKTSILFTTPDKPGALVGVLGSLAGQGINMTKLESRPFPGESWKYVFFADLECDFSSEEYQSLLTTLREQCQILRVLGSYPSGRKSGEVY